MNCGDARRRASTRSSSPARCSSSRAIAARSWNQVFSHIAWAKTSSKGCAAEGTSSARHSGRPASVGAFGTLPSTSPGMREVAALLGAPARDRDPVREVAVAAPRLRQQHQARVRRAAAGQRQADLAADDEVQLLRLRLDVRAHDAGERALVGDRERAVAERRGALDQLLGVRGAGQEAEVAAAVELGVAREHGRARGGGLAGARGGASRSCRGRASASCVVVGGRASASSASGRRAGWRCRPRPTAARGCRSWSC